jgi:hypothetical protein
MSLHLTLTLIIFGVPTLGAWRYERRHHADN